MSKTKSNRELEKSLLVPLLAGSGLSAGLLLARFLSAQSTRFWFMMWNLVLAWLPLLFAWKLTRWVKRNAWGSWQGVLLTFLWLFSLPNAFYIITDFIHLRPTGEVSVLFDTVLLMSFALNGMMLGYLSILLVHLELRKRLAEKKIIWLLAILFLLCGFGIYMGRYLAWNTWDMIINPAGIIIDIAERLVSPLSYPNTFTTTGMFFVLLSTVYFMIYRLVELLRRPGK